MRCSAQRCSPSSRASASRHTQGAGSYGATRVAVSQACQDSSHSSCVRRCSSRCARSVRSTATRACITAAGTLCGSSASQARTTSVPAAAAASTWVRCVHRPQVVVCSSRVRMDIQRPVRTSWRAARSAVSWPAGS